MGVAEDLICGGLGSRGLRSLAARKRPFFHRLQRLHLRPDSHGACFKSMLLTVSRGWGIIRSRIAITTLRPYSCQANKQWTTPTTVLQRHRSLSTSNNLLAKRRKDFFSSNASIRLSQREKGTTEQQQQLQELQEQGKERKPKRSPPGKTSLRRVAVEAQRSKDGHELKRSASLGSQTATKESSKSTF